MKTKILVAVILISSSLTSWAWFAKSITQQKIDQIRVGQTTEADLVYLFGAPTTKFIDLSHLVSLDWFRSVPMPPTGYLPIVGQFLGGLDTDAQQLSVVLGGGRVLRYEVHSSRGRLHARTQTVTTTVRETRYSK